MTEPLDILMHTIMKIMKIVVKKIATIYLKALMTIFYPSSVMYSKVNFWEYVFPQKILNINGSRRCIWPVHFTSRVNGHNRIKVGKFTAPGRSPGCYIQATNGLIIGENLTVAPGVKIISANHDYYNYRKHTETRPIRIGNNCWLGANSVILSGVELGEHVIVGAGAVVTKSFPDNCVVCGVPAKLIKKIDPYKSE